MIAFIERIKEQQSIATTMAWICIVCATLLTLPTSVFQKSNVDNASFLTTPYVWVLALLTGSYLLTICLRGFFGTFKRRVEERQLSDRRNKMIRQLDFEEKAVLREFIIQRKNVLALPMSEPAISNLMESGVLVPSFETQEIKGNSRIIKLSIAIDARQLLTLRVLGLPVGKLTEEEATLLKAARPEYARSNYISL
ncbi:hypothetical protein PCNPT3_01175 [Psychromonas sp. CNPT3]|uniref:superinfection exclusion B family protein n=1 Tax=Psychromonas sp. CNPT3 TaxID=314282 RepID=UPI00006E9CB5|nr:superinfection exclusion B family protein [Psychromonas sp. CNPT3]AGH80177.1 hypothetical protein PCNPT3_01175 [Psychromonas sp. CNPT3]